jgi:hypothetical protein
MNRFNAARQVAAKKTFWTGFTGFAGLRSDQAILVLFFRNPVHLVNPVHFVP